MRGAGSRSSENASDFERASGDGDSSAQALIGTELFSGWFPKVDQIPFKLIW